MRALLILCLLLSVGGISTCEAQTWLQQSGTWRPPATARQITPDSMWLAQYKEAEKCVGWQGDVADVKWFLVPGSTIAGERGESNIAIWTPPHSIYITEAYAKTPWVIRHESLHDILRIVNHPTGIWGKLCAATWGYLNPEGA